MRLLITGGSGLLGSKTASIAIENGIETYSGYNEHNVTKGIPVRLDVSNRYEVSKTFNRIKPEAIVHAAAMTNVDKCEEDQETARRINIEGTRNIVQSSVRHNAFLVYISTDYIFSGERGMYKETDIPKPINHYGLTKLEAENIVKASTIDWCIARPSVIYGSTPASGKTNFALWVLNELEKGEAIKIVTDQWVSPTLNSNLAEMVLEIIKRRLKGTYHLSGATPLNRYEFATRIAETFQLDKTLIIPGRSCEMKWLAKRPQNTSLNVRKASTILQNKPLEIDKALDKLKKELNNKKNQLWLS